MFAASAGSALMAAVNKGRTDKGEAKGLSSGHYLLHENAFQAIATKGQSSQ
jgi:hypothetical protein